MAASRSLLGKVALITGASQGIGAATALHLAQLGAKVVINYSSNAKPAEELVQKIGSDNAIAIKADAGNLRDIECLVNETLAWGGGKIDILIPNAASGATGKGLDNTSEEDFDKVVGLNVKGPYFLVQKAAPHMAPGSHILLFSTSLTGLSQILPNYLLYVTTKGAVEQMTRVLAKDLGRKGIVVNAIAPGPTSTALFLDGKSEELIKTMASWNPFNRLGTPEDIARTAGWLVGPDNTWVQGQIIKTNGGMQL
ncbi:NAD(P)-binding protein [Karstenula rhodostoma CBS 690.94]|uniref:NAD(P)-binding protein n=1 Tax=Karstenula rhodostoma CBS 690.94 TaxID=1392251 RepID=A0A9P4U889_9PLEO|nr:NAD(P)-binding protein [Karstenula rhodostoma CBS 690.94]